MPKYRRGASSEYQKRGYYYIKFYVDGKPITEATRTKDRAEARRQLQARVGQLAEARYVGPAVERVKFAELADLILADYRINGKRSIRNLEVRLEKHVLPRLGHLRAHEVSANHIQSFIADRKEDGASNAEINRELSVIKRCFNLGRQQERITKKPYIPRLAEDNVRKGSFEASEFETLLAELPAHLRPPVSFAFFTGWRFFKEILSLTWDQVDLDMRSVTLYPGETKNRDGRTIQLPRVLLGLLEDQWRTRPAGCLWVFHNHGERIKSPYPAWRKATQATGLTGRVFNDLRRTAIGNMVRAGIPERVAMQITGHKTRSIFDRYHIVSEGDLKEAARRMDDQIAARPESTGGNPLAKSKSGPLEEAYH